MVIKPEITTENKRTQEVIVWQGFHEIIGHDDVVNHLQNAIQMGKVSHAYIFNGEVGAGKKMLASAFAMALQCEKHGTDPCMECDSCKRALKKITRILSDHT